MKLIEFLLSLPKTIYFNFKYLPFNQAIKLPILIRYDVILNLMRGKIYIKDHIKFALISVGFTNSPLVMYNGKTIWHNEGTIIFEGKANIGMGCRIITQNEHSEIVFGQNFKVTGDTKIWCRNLIKFGKNNLISYNNNFMDTDGHHIFYKNSDNKINEDTYVILGDNIWTCCNCTILKSTTIGNNIIIASNTTIKGDYSLLSNCILGNNNVNCTSIFKKNIYWKY